MMTFFRKIRKTILGSGLTGRYMLYATGEIFLVMIGILLALQVNNWNEERKARQKEKEILGQLAYNIQANIDVLTRGIQIDENFGKSYYAVMKILEYQLPWHDTIGAHMENAMVSRVPTLSFAAYESLKNEGFEIIQSLELRESIINLYENYNSSTTTITRVVHTELKPRSSDYIMSHFVRTLAERGTILIPNDYQAVLKDQEFVNIISYIHGMRTTFFNRIMTRALERSEAVLDLIEKELEANNLNK